MTSTKWLVVDVWQQLLPLMPVFIVPLRRHYTRFQERKQTSVCAFLLRLDVSVQLLCNPAGLSGITPS